MLLTIKKKKISNDNTDNRIFEEIDIDLQNNVILRFFVNRIPAYKKSVSRETFSKNGITHLI